MTILKNLLAASALAGTFAMPALAQDRVQSTAPEPATSPSEAATPPQPAQPPSAQVGPAAAITYSFELLDRNHDNGITADEAARVPELLRLFEQLDRNRDGRLDRSEFVGFSK